MAEVIYYFAMSADGFIARPDGSYDWLEKFPPEDFGYAEFMAGLSGIVMGRGTYDAVRRHDWWPYTDVPCLVATSNPVTDLPPRTKAAAGAPGVLLAELGKMGAEGRIWVLGGGQLAGQFMDAGLLDVIEAAQIPVILGNGIPAFGRPESDHWLDLDFARPHGSGAIHLRWRVRKT